MAGKFWCILLSTGHISGQQLVIIRHVRILLLNVPFVRYKVITFRTVHQLVSKCRENKMVANKMNLKHGIWYGLQQGSNASFPCKNLWDAPGNEIKNFRNCQGWFAKFCFEDFSLGNDILRCMLESYPHLITSQLQSNLTSIVRLPRNTSNSIKFSCFI